MIRNEPVMPAVSMAATAGKSDRLPNLEVNSGSDRELPIAFRELIALSALVMSMTAMSIDIMLPALPDIGSEFRVGSASDLPLVVTACMFGMALGQLVWGPLADRIGRRATLLAGLGFFIVASAFALLSDSFGHLLAARFLQGVGASVGRIVVTAIVRDLFVGRQMARTMSMVMMVFILVPLLAPVIGQFVVVIGSWRWVLAILLMAGAIAMVWTAARLPETRAISISAETRLSTAQALRLVVANRIAVGYALAAGFMHAMLVSYLASSQQIFGGAYGLGKLFPLAFAGIAAALALASLLNVHLVQRLGMRRLSHCALVALIVSSAVLAMLAGRFSLPLWVALGGTALCYFLYGLIVSNFGAIAMQPMGHVAGMAASITGCGTTLIGAALGTIAARQFDGSIFPLFCGYAALTTCALVAVLVVERGSLFHGE